MQNLLQNSLREGGIDLSADLLEREEFYLREVLRWNERVNLTAIKDPKEALEKHLVDSLMLLNFIEKKGRMLDMGSGAGFPGIPLAIAMPEIEVVSVDSVGKKINFQKHIKRQLHLANLFPECSRLEDIHPAGEFDFVVARALSKLSDLLRWAKPVLKNAGLLYVMKGPEGKAELDAFLCRKQVDGFVFERQQTYHLPQSGAERQLYVLKNTLNS